MTNNNTRPNLERIRQQFPALARWENNQQAIFADAPGGTQMPGGVIQAMSGYLEQGTANLDGCFATSIETTQLMHSARTDCPVFFKCHLMTALCLVPI